MRKVVQLFFEWNLPHTTTQLTGISLPLATPSNIFGGRSEGLIKYMALDRGSFLSIQSFIHHITYSCLSAPNIQSLFMYNDHLVTSSFCLSATRLLYSYTTAQILPEAVCEEMSWSKKRETSTTYWLYDRKPLLIFLPEKDDFDSQEDVIKDCRKCDLYGFRSVNGATVLIIMSALDLSVAGTQVEIQRKTILDSIELYAKQNWYQLSITLSRAVAQKASSQFSDHQIFHSSPDSGIESAGLSFLYYNEANAALKTSSSISSVIHRQVSSASLHSSVAPSLVPKTDPFNSWISIEADLRTLILPTAHKSRNESENRSTEGALEILAKTETEDHWVIFKRSDGRVLFATLSAHKNLNLEEVASICNSRWSSFLPSASMIKDLRISSGTSLSSTSNQAASFLPFSTLFQ